MKTVLRSVLTMVVCLLLTAKANAQIPVVNSATPVSTTIGKFEKFEVDVAITANFTNPYDYDQIAVTCTITKPGGAQETIDGFYMQNFTLGANGFASATGSSSFKLRYSPTMPGTYSYVVSATNALGTGSLAAQSFQCVPTELPGFIRRNSTNYLTFDNGAQYIPIGENVGWQNGSVTADYTKWVSKLSANGGNFIRVWMSSWAFALEWKTGNGFEGLKKYKQSNAFYLDWLLDYCKDQNMYMMLALNNHGQVSTNVNPEWANNPYNAANGGPAVNTWDFFTSTTAKNLHKNRLRYIIARYGYSKQIQSWELFNELHWTDQFESRKSDLTAWDNEMSTYIKSKDVNNHLVTTSYGGDDIATATWSLPNIDFTQTHYYVNTPAIETVLSAGNQNFLAAYNKPTLNGEFGLGPDGPVLAADDPSGVHVHNAIWGSTFSGGLGSGMTWWWDNYVEPQSLYYHFKPLSQVVSLINFPGDNYKKFQGQTSGGGAADVTVSPGGGFAKAAAFNFTIDASGILTPGSSSMSQYLFGSTYNTQNRNPPVFNVNFPTAGQFKVVTASVSNSSPKITIYLNGVQLLNADATANTTYTIDVPAGQQTIKVDNLGIDWAQISNYVFTNIGAPITVYSLKSAANNKAAGYLLNNKYNWQYLKANNNTPPPALTGVTLQLPGMANGNYTMYFYHTITGNTESTVPVTVTNGTLTVPVPDINWDLAFRVAENSTLPLRLLAFKGEKAGNKNRLFINIASSDNVKAVYLQRSATSSQFTNLALVSSQWNTIDGNHLFVDESPNRSINFYRLKIVDNDGSETFSGIVKLVNTNSVFTVHPNPFNAFVNIHLQAGKYSIRLVDEAGRTALQKSVDSANGQDVRLSTQPLAKGIYNVIVYDENGLTIGAQKLIK